MEDRTGKIFTRIYTTAGEVRLITANEFFAESIVQYVDTLTTYVDTPLIVEASNNCGLTPSIEASYSRREIKLNPVFEKKMSYEDLRKSGYSSSVMCNSDAYLRSVGESFRSDYPKFINSKFKSMVAKKNPEFLTKDLTVDRIEELAITYLENFGCESLIAFPFNLSKYQKYFVIAEYSAFRLFLTRVRCYQTHIDLSIEFKQAAEFVELNPTKWVIGKYEDLTYLKELTIQRDSMLKEHTDETGS